MALVIDKKREEEAMKGKGRDRLHQYVKHEYIMDNFIAFFKISG